MCVCVCVCVCVCIYIYIYIYIYDISSLSVKHLNQAVLCVHGIIIAVGYSQFKSCCLKHPSTQTYDYSVNGTGTANVCHMYFRKCIGVRVECSSAEDELF